MMTDNPVLIADIGGTNARFAFASTAPNFYTQAQTFKAAEFDHVYDAIDLYLQSHGVTRLSGISLAVAGPIKNHSVTIPNNHWFVSSQDLRERYKTERAHLFNDWEAIAYSLSHLSSNDLLAIGGEWGVLPDSDFNVAALGPGSGLGMSGLLRRNNNLIPLVTEGGHAGFSPETQLQGDILAYLRRKFDGRISRERLLSGPGLINMHEALCAIRGQQNPGLTAADIADAGIGQTDPVCMQALDLFFEILGQVAGDIALEMGAYQGVFVSGGICQRYPIPLQESQFRKGFENKGRNRQLMLEIPTWLITHKNPGLVGASVYSKTEL